MFNMSAPSLADIAAVTRNNWSSLRILSCMSREYLKEV